MENGNMLKLIPKPKKCNELDTFINIKGIKIESENIDARLLKIINKLPLDENGIELKIELGEGNTEAYNLKISSDGIVIKAEGIKGAFYGVQTLRQILENEKIPCLEIEDKPDFKFRCAYLDITRGKIPKLETIKKFIDKIAYMKMNALQLYVEHTYEFKEYADSLERTGYITADELKELDLYCKENFIDFIPSLSTFGHLYELLQKDRYKHLRMLEDYDPDKAENCLWLEKGMHHTLDPLNPESIELVKSLIDQYCENFTSEWFNICCDETFDLKTGEKHKDKDPGELYINFVLQIIEHLKKKGKKVMMWGDVLSSHPEQLSKLSEDIMLLNWYYRANPEKEIVKRFYDKGRKQILCVGTSAWVTMVEDIDTSLPNIENMLNLGYEYGAKGIITSIWGDFGNMASQEMTDCSLSFGADKSWNVDSKKEDIFEKVDLLIYKTEGMSDYLKELVKLQQKMPIWGLVCLHEDSKGIKERTFQYFADELILPFREECEDFIGRLKNEDFDNEYKKEMLSVAKCLLVIAEIGALYNGSSLERHSDTLKWLKEYRSLWISKNKESELRVIEQLFEDLEEEVSRR